MATGLPLITIVGPTASGKTALAIELAERWNGEIICADSRTVYKGMDIGTAKPTATEQAKVPHWGIDLVEPSERFTASDFKRYADEKIEDIRSRGKVPFLVGGTGLYIDAVVYDFTFTDVAEKTDDGFRHMNVDELINYCIQHNVTLPENSRNKRHLFSAIRRKSTSGIRKASLQQNAYIVGIATNKDTLRTRIVHRAEQLFQDDVVNEATILGKKYGWKNEAMTGNIYPLIKSYLEHQFTLDEIKKRFTTLDWQLAKRQMTWFRRNPDIFWCSITEANKYINHVLADE
jgi:tRNA dimethylallyltransferase